LIRGLPRDSILLTMRFRGVHGFRGIRRASQAKEKQALKEAAAAKTNLLHSHLLEHATHVSSAILGKTLGFSSIGLAGTAKSPLGGGFQSIFAGREFHLASSCLRDTAPEETLLRRAHTPAPL